jgi:hypothetical protein
MFNGGRSSVGRAPDCDSGCRGFDPHRSPHFSRVVRPNVPVLYQSHDQPLLLDGHYLNVHIAVLFRMKTNRLVSVAHTM